MNIAQTASKATKLKLTTTEIFIKLDFDLLANDINNGELEHQFDGKGCKVAYIPDTQESKYLYYSSDKAGIDKIEPPFVINNGDNIKFNHKSIPNAKSKTKSKWKGIIQNNNDLHLVKGCTYNAEIIEGVARSENDDVIINIKFKLKGDEFLVSWDPRVRVRGH